MAENISNMNIYQRLAKIRKPVEIIKKNRSGFGYNYVTEDEILAKITGSMDKYGVSLIPNIPHDCTTVEPYQYTKSKRTKDGKVYDEQVNEIMVRGEMDWVWVNNDNPEDRIVVPWFFIASQGDASQSFGSALTYASRYFLLKYFNVATSDDDPDNWRSKQREAEATEDRLLAEKIIDRVNELVNEHMKTAPDDKQKIIAITKKYAKENGKPTANYYVINNSETASELLNALEDAFGVGKKESKED